MVEQGACRQGRVNLESLGAGQDALQYRAGSTGQVVVYLKSLYMTWRFINSHRVTLWNLEANYPKC